MRFLPYLGAGLLHFATSAGGIEFNPDDEASIRAATQQYSHGLMSYYKGNASGLAKEDVGVFEMPYYWWMAGAVWGGMIEYSKFTGDDSYVPTITQALVANYGPNNDILLPWRKNQEGNDDQAFWALALMSALEYDFPDPEQPPPATYLEVLKNCFDNIAARWDESSCDGGFKWQIYPENSYGYNYKNSISNGAVFALGARLARYTGNQAYADWATKIFDWTKHVGLINDRYEVFDGTDDRKNCEKQDHTEWSYNIGIYLHGAAVMYNYTDGDETWKGRTSGLLDHAGKFFSPYENATDIMYEQACETGDRGRICNLDQQSFKAYLSRFLAKTGTMAPFTKDKVTNWLRKSAEGAAKACSGGPDGSTCGSKWYTGGWDGTSGLGQQLSALEVTQALLSLMKDIAPGTADGRSYAAPAPSSTPPANESPTPTSTSHETSSIPESTPSSTPNATSSVVAGPSTSNSAAASNSTVPGLQEESNSGNAGVGGMSMRLVMAACIAVGVFIYAA